MGIIEVVCGIICKGGKVLICRRNSVKALAGYWEFPGGKIEIGEKPIASLKRELLEELGMEVSNVVYFMENDHSYGTLLIRLHAYTCKFMRATFEMTDHDDYKWVDLSELEDFLLAPADVPIAVALSNLK